MIEMSQIKTRDGCTIDGNKSRGMFRDIGSRQIMGFLFILGLGLGMLSASAQEPIAAQVKPDFTTTYGPAADRQKVNIYQAKSPNRCPIVAFAHSNGHTFDDVSPDLIGICHSRGITVLSWESVGNLSRNNIDLLDKDAKAFLLWLKDPAIAQQYNLDPTRIILSGNSRGSWASWLIGHSGDPAIKGLFLYRALPGGSDASPKVYEMINVNSPPAIFIYRKSDTTGLHAIVNGTRAIEKYTSLGINDRTSINYIEGLGGRDEYKYLPNFIKHVFPLDVARKK